VTDDDTSQFCALQPLCPRLYVFSRFYANRSLYVHINKDYLPVLTYLLYLHAQDSARR